MIRSNRSFVRIRQQGQTLIIALIVMGVLLILGLVFLGLINRNILNAARSQRRSEASDLAEAGIRYAHGQLVSSPLGADWRGVPTVLAPSPANANATLDPDAYYLRPGSGIDDGTGLRDLGGPDRLGPFVRLPFPGGRSLVRVRYGASDANPTPSVSGGPLRNPGAARSTLVIEAIGRPGVVNPKDPTTLNAQNGIQFQAFADNNALTAAIASMALANGQISTSRRLVAFAPIGIIDAARFETNVFNSSAPIEIGIAEGLGIASYEANTVQDVGALLPLQLGTPGDVTTAGNRSARGFGSFIANGDVKIFGRINANLNSTLGDTFRVAGRVSGSVGAQLNIAAYKYDPGTNTYPVTPMNYQLTDGGGSSFDSQDPSFNTAGGLFLDGSARTDAVGFASGVGKLVPPSILTVDPQTKLNRYVAMTRESGVNLGSGNSGRYGQGQGIYVDNTADRQEAVDAEGRKAVGSQRSLFDDWLNPNSGAADSGWKGPFYQPRGSVVQLLPDGWSIQRDGSAPASERTWKRPDGTDSGLTTIRYRVGRATDGSLRTLNTLTVADPADINATGLNFNSPAAMPFNGVLYFEGNVRVRGTIPTGVQLTLSSGATIYIDGSIIKGFTNNEVTDPSLANRDRPIAGLPTASLMLMAKDNVAVNTSMFLGPEANQVLEAVNDVAGATGISPVRLRAAGGSESGRLSLITEMVMDPSDALGNPILTAQNWRPYALTYRQWDKTTLGVPTQLLVGTTMDDGTAAASFYALDVNFGLGDSRYFFPGVDPDGLITNTAAAYSGPPTPALTEIYGLGAEPWQRYSRFELRNFALIANPTAATYTANTGAIGQPGLNYTMSSGANDVLLRPGSIASVSANDTLIGRAALAPGEVKIEASIFAEQGSFFVIPGPWFNPNPNDRHDLYDKRVFELQAAPFNLSAAQAQFRAARERLEAYGAAPWVPFYAEPLDLRINVVGSVAENLPPSISVQSEWIRKWGWIPRRTGATGIGIPLQHVPGLDPAYLATQNFVPNLIIQYDPVLATGRVNSPGQPNPIRTDNFGRPLPPMPRLPVSPRLAYFGEL